MRTPSSPACWTSTRLRAAISIGSRSTPPSIPPLRPGTGAETVSGGSLILDTGERSAVLDAADFYVYDYADYYTYSVRFDGEQQITAALYRLTSGEPSQAYYTTGHGEKKRCPAPCWTRWKPRTSRPSPSACCRGRCLRTARCSSSTAPLGLCRGGGGCGRDGLPAGLSGRRGARCWS